MTKSKYNPGGIKIPAPGGNAVPGGYTGPTPHAANVDHRPYVAPSDVPSADPPVSNSAGFDAMNGLGEPTKI